MKLFLVILLIGAAGRVVGAQGPAPKLGIRAVDFSNFTFPWNRDVGVKGKTFTLTKGELPPTRDRDGAVARMGMSLRSVRYGDVTGDGVEEAMVFVSVQTGGSSIPGVLYVYTLKQPHPALLWSRSTGDRADGGFRTAYAEDGRLILELNDPQGSRGACCPVKFARLRYEWRKNGFSRSSKQVLPLPAMP